MYDEKDYKRYITEDYKRYVTCFAKTHGITEIQAEQHLIVKYYREYLKERAKNDGKRQTATSSK